MNNLEIWSEKATELDQIIMRTYEEIFETKKGVPSVRDVFQKMDYDFEAKAYDITTGIKKDEITEDRIMHVLSDAGCVFKFTGHLICDAQQVLFADLYNEEIVDYFIEETSYVVSANKRR